MALSTRGTHIFSGVGAPIREESMGPQHPSKFYDLKKIPFKKKKKIKNIATEFSMRTAVRRNTFRIESE